MDRDWYRTRFRYGADVPIEMSCQFKLGDYMSYIEHGGTKFNKKFVRDYPVKFAKIIRNCYGIRYCCGYDTGNNFEPNRQLHCARYASGWPTPGLDQYDVRDGHSLHSLHYTRGGNLGQESMAKMTSRDHRERFANGFELANVHMANLLFCADDTLFAAHYRNGGDNRFVDMSRLSAADHRERLEHGYYVDPKYWSGPTPEMRICMGFDPVNRPVKLSYHLGYRTPEKYIGTFTERDQRIRDNYFLGESCMLALTGQPFAISALDSADFEYVLGRPAPDFLELRAPDGEIVFRMNAGALKGPVCIDAICDNLRSERWGGHFVGDVVGTIYLAPIAK